MNLIANNRTNSLKQSKSTCARFDSRSRMNYEKVSRSNSGQRNKMYFKPSIVEVTQENSTSEISRDGTERHTNYLLQPHVPP